ncbi:MAG: rhombosortase [Gammaproteobacteria bacterium]|nr:rhombosortase [Gammaproteobacteria bacterium]
MNKINIFIVVIILWAALSQLTLLLGVDWLQYAKPEIEAGQWWRFVTGNFIHLNWKHFAMNAVALIVIYQLFSNLLKARALFLVFILSCLSVTLGLWLFNPSVYWYVGLSGALHGVLVTLLIVDNMTRKHILNNALLIIVIGKLVWEAYMGPLPGSEFVAGGPIVVDAHLYGAFGGIIIAACFWFRKYNINS